MFKNPVNVQIEAKQLTVKHEITVSDTTANHAIELVGTVGKTAIAVIAMSAIASVTKDVVKNILDSK